MRSGQKPQPGFRQPPSFLGIERLINVSLAMFLHLEEAAMLELPDVSA
jgi:hypothetical protein